MHFEITYFNIQIYLQIRQYFFKVNSRMEGIGNRRKTRSMNRSTITESDVPKPPKKIRLSKCHVALTNLEQPEEIRSSESEVVIVQRDNLNEMPTLEEIPNLAPVTPASASSSTASSLIASSPIASSSNASSSTAFSPIASTSTVADTNEMPAVEEAATPSVSRKLRKKHEALEYEGHTWHVNKVLKEGNTIYFDCAQ